ncbi:hypothetical protein K1X84_07645 [bacterium]|nr:hypothetical protein [bacterium]
MKNSSIVIILLITAIGVHAQDKGFGLGVIIGEPTGLNGKYWLTQNTALDFSAAWSFVDGGRKGDDKDAVQLHSDYLIHHFNLIPVDKGRLPLYYGIGARIVLSDKTGFGARIPVGLDYHFQNAPVDIFFEIVPVLDLIPSTDFDLNGAIGVRFWFK